MLVRFSFGVHPFDETLTETQNMTKRRTGSYIPKSRFRVRPCIPSQDEFSAAFAISIIGFSAVHRTTDSGADDKTTLSDSKTLILPSFILDDYNRAIDLCNDWVDPKVSTPPSPIFCNNIDDGAISADFFDREDDPKVSTLDGKSSTDSNSTVSVDFHEDSKISTPPIDSENFLSEFVISDIDCHDFYCRDAHNQAAGINFYENRVVSLPTNKLGVCPLRVVSQIAFEALYVSMGNARALATTDLCNP
jgi:hypothetical protein